MESTFCHNINVKTIVWIVAHPSLMSCIDYWCGFHTVFYLKEFGLKSSEGTSNPEIQFLSGIHWQSLVLVRGNQLCHRSFYVFVGYGTELRSKYSLQITIKHTNNWNISHFVLESSPQLFGWITPYTMLKLNYNTRCKFFLSFLFHRLLGTITPFRGCTETSYSSFTDTARHVHSFISVHQLKLLNTTHRKCRSFFIVTV